MTEAQRKQHGHSFALSFQLLYRVQLRKGHIFSPSPKEQEEKLTNFEKIINQAVLVQCLQLLHMQYTQAHIARAGNKTNKRK